MEKVTTPHEDLLWKEWQHEVKRWRPHLDIQVVFAFSLIVTTPREFSLLLSRSRSRSFYRLILVTINLERIRSLSSRHQY